MLNNGFFSGKNKKNEDNEKENNDDEYNDKIREVMKKYQNNGKIIEKIKFYEFNISLDVNYFSYGN